MWGALQMGDPQVTIGFNTEMVYIMTWIFSGGTLQFGKPPRHVDALTRPGFVAIHRALLELHSLNAKNGYNSQLPHCGRGRLGHGGRLNTQKMGMPSAGRPNRHRGPFFILGYPTWDKPNWTTWTMFRCCAQLLSPAMHSRDNLRSREPITHSPGHRPLRTGADGLNMEWHQWSSTIPLTILSSFRFWNNQGL